MVLFERLNSAVLIIALTLTACQTPPNRDEQYTPNGLLGIYSDFIDYNIPPIKEGYSGLWKGGSSVSLYEEGAYINGIPAGIWKGYYQNGNPRVIAIYDGDFGFQETWFYPDGTPLHVAQGQYSVNKSDITRKILHFLSYDETGNVIFSDKNGPNSEIIVRVAGDGSFDFEGEEMLCTYESIIFKDGRCSALAYIYPKNKRTVCYAKVKASASFDFKDNKFYNISQTNYYGNFKISFATNDKGFAYVRLLSPKDESLLVMLYAGKPATFKKE